MVGRFAQYQEGLRITVGFVRIRLACESMRIGNPHHRFVPSGVGEGNLVFLGCSYGKVTVHIQNTNVVYVAQYHRLTKPYINPKP